MPIIPDIQEAEKEGSEFKASEGKNISETLSQKQA
jgi:hypothetical protein